MTSLPSEVVHEVGTLSNIFTSKFGENNVLGKGLLYNTSAIIIIIGGLAGIPFMGRSGFNSIAHRIQ